MTGNQACNDNDRETQTERERGGVEGQGDEMMMMMMIERMADIKDKKRPVTGQRMSRDEKKSGQAENEGGGGGGGGTVGGGRPILTTIPHQVIKCWEHNRRFLWKH